MEIKPQKADIDRLEKKMEELKDNNDEINGSDALGSEEDMPSEYECPISYEIMSNPVVAADGHTYEHSAIKDWLQNNEESPVTHKKLQHKHLAVNFALQHSIGKYLEKKRKNKVKKDKGKKSNFFTLATKAHHLKSSALIVENKVYWSQLDSREKLREQVYAVSIINYKNKKHREYRYGHPYILVEGIKEGVLYVRLYDIYFRIEEDSNWNPKGVVIAVNERKNKGDVYPLSYNDDKDFYKSLAYTYLVSNRLASKMIESIKQDKERVTRFNNLGEGAPLLFQMVGPSDRKGVLAYLFSENDRGVNSASWCMDKLKIAGISINAKSKGDSIIKNAKSQGNKAQQLGK